MWKNREKIKWSKKETTLLGLVYVIWFFVYGLVIFEYIERLAKSLGLPHGMKLIIHWVIGIAAVLILGKIVTTIIQKQKKA